MNISGQDFSEVYLRGEVIGAMISVLVMAISGGILLGTFSLTLGLPLNTLLVGLSFGVLNKKA